MKKQIDTAAQILTFTFGDGVAPLTLAMRDVSPECATYAMLHGFAQRCGDNAAGAKTEAERRTAVAEMVDYYASGAKEWTTRKPTQRQLIPALVAMAERTGRSYAELESAYIAKLEAELADL